MSAAELTRTGADTSGLACYSCHDEKKPVQITFDAKGAIALPEAHKDLVIHHGRSGRNDHCFGCHDPKNLEQLRVREGKAFKLTESNQLCGSCHGPTYDDWEHHLHGRVSGSWLTQSTNHVRQDCTSCHDPHSPAFPSIKPAPAPHPRLLQAGVHLPEPKAH
jgi:hypothetical protein